MKTSFSHSKLSLLHIAILCIMTLSTSHSEVKTVKCSTSVTSQISCNTVSSGQLKDQCLDKIIGIKNNHKYSVCLVQGSENIMINLEKNYGFVSYRLLINQELIIQRQLSMFFYSPKELFEQIKKYQAELIIEDNGVIKIMISDNRKPKKYLTLHTREHKITQTLEVIDKVVQGRNQINSQFAQLKQQQIKSNDKMRQQIKDMKDMIGKQTQSFNNQLRNKDNQIKALNQRNDDLSRQLNEQNGRLESLQQRYNNIKGQIIEHIRVNGIQIGNWKIQAHKVALVFIYIVSWNKGIDHRYAMWNQIYRDL